MSTPGPSGTSSSQFRPLSSKPAIDPLGEEMVLVEPIRPLSSFVSNVIYLQFLPALGLRAPLGAQGGYPAAFSIAHPSVNAEGAGAYAGLHLMSPQLNGAAAGTYGRSSLVSEYIVRLDLL